MTSEQRSVIGRRLITLREELLGRGPSRIEPNRRDTATAGVADEDAQALSEMHQVLASQNNGCYHTVNDDVKYVDFKKLKCQTHVGFRTAMALTETDTPPTSGPQNPNGASFSDLERVAGVVAKRRADLALFSEADQALVQSIDATLQALVADGPAAFDGQDVGTLLGAAIQTVDALRRVPCQKF